MTSFVLLLLVVVGLVMLGGLAFIGALFSMAGADKKRARSVENADAILDETFDGAVSVTYESTPRTLPFENVVQGAIERGYSLAGQTESPGGYKTLVFTKASSESRTA